jgi:hypothetical protein
MVSSLNQISGLSPFGLISSGNKRAYKYLDFLFTMPVLLVFWALL